MTRPRDDDGYLEFQLDGRQMLIVLVGVVILCGISFYIGKQMGRSEVTGEGEGLTAGTVSADARLSEEDPAAGLNFFDAVQQELPPENLFDENPDLQPGRPSASVRPSKPASEPPPVEKAAASTVNRSRKVVGAPEAGAEVPAQGQNLKAASGGSPSKVSRGAGVEVQVALLGTRAAADRLAKRLRRKGYDASVTPFPPRGYRVRVGGYPDRAAAKRAAGRLKREEKLDAWIPKVGE